MDKWRFKRFRRNMIRPGSVVVIIGKKGSGKTTLLADICHSLRACPEVSLYQKTYKSNLVFHDVVPDTFCYTSWDSNRIRQLIRRQERNNSKRIKQGRQPKYHTIIVDDLACDPAFTKDKLLEELFMNARWLKLNILITLQDALKIHPALRGNTDWVFALKENNPKARERLQANYFGQLGKHFDKIYDKFTDNRKAIVLDNTGQSTRIEDNYYFYKATLRDFHEHPHLKKWKMGSKKYWAFHYQHYNKHYDSSSDEEDNNSDIIIFNK